MSAAKDLQAMILWCRQKGIVWTTLTAGTMTIEGQDLRLAESLPQPKVTDAPAKPSIWTKYGGDLLKEAADSEGMTSVVEEQD